MTKSDLIFKYVMISAVVAVFWYAVMWFLYRDLAMMVGFVGFLFAFGLLLFNYGANKR